MLTVRGRTDSWLKLSCQTWGVIPVKRSRTKTPWFTKAVCVDMHFVYGFSDWNYLAALRQYKNRYPDRTQPFWRVLERLQCNLRETGTLDWLIDWLTMEGWNYVSELRPPTGLLFNPRVICEHGRPWWGWCRLGITPDSSTRAFWQSNQKRRLRQVGGMDEGVRILLISIWNPSRDL
jgi:hypothetical protein